MNLFHEAKQILDKDGKVNPLGPYGKMKLTGQEVASYFRKNRVSDPEVKKAVEVALDLGGAYDVARKEIAKFFGDKILKSKEVQTALRFANEEVVTEGKLGDSIIRKDFPNVWAASAKDKEILKKFHAKVDTKNYKQMKDAYKKDMKKFVDDLKKVKLSDLLKSMQVKGGKWDGWMTDEVQKEEVVAEGTMAIGIFDSNPAEKRKAIAGMQKLLKGKQNVKVGSPEGQKIGDELDMKYLSDDELADDFARSSNKNMTISQLLKKHEKRLGLNFKEEVEEAVSPAQQAAIAIAKKEKEEKNESVFNSYRRMVEMWLDEEVSNLTVDPKNKLSKPADQNKHALEIVKNARRFGLKASFMGKHVRIKGAKKAVNDFLRTVVGRSSYGDPTEKDMSTPQIDKMLTKDLK